MDPDPRTEQFREMLDLIPRCWTDERVTIRGARYAIEPKPIQSPHPPVYIGGYSDVSLMWAAQAGHRVIPRGIQSPASLRCCLDRFGGAGGDIAQAPVGRFVYVQEHDAVARQEA